MVRIYGFIEKSAKRLVIWLPTVV